MVMARIRIARTLVISTFALFIQPVSSAGADAVTDWNVPVTAIRAAADLNIPTLKGDPNWEPLLVTPPQPDYPSTHCIFPAPPRPCCAASSEAMTPTSA